MAEMMGAKLNKQELQMRAFSSSHTAVYKSIYIRSRVVSIECAVVGSLSGGRSPTIKVGQPARSLYPESDEP